MGKNRHGGPRPGSGRKPLTPEEKALRPPSPPRVRNENGQFVKAAPAPPRASVGMDLRAAARIIQASEQLAKARNKDPRLNPFQLLPNLFPPAAVPEDRKLRIAMDSSLNWASGQWAAMPASIFSAEGQQFLGYPYLSELAQRPEYRVISETIADDATRMWVDFEIVGSKEENERRREEDEADPEGARGRREQRVADSGKADKVKALKDDMERLKLRDHVYGVCRDDGFFGRSHLALLFGNDELDKDGISELTSPIGDGRNELSRQKVGKENPLKRVQRVEPIWTYPTTYNAVNPLLEDWYNPQVWFVLGKQVHSSRLPTFIGHPVPDILKPVYAFGGLSLSQMAKPYVDIWLQTRQSVGQLVHSFSVMVLATDAAVGLQGDASSLLARVAAFNALRDNQGTFVINKNTEEFSNVQASLSGLHELQAQAQEHMMSVVRIPATKFTGIQPSGLSTTSEGEMRAYYDTISAYQNRFIRPNLERILNFQMLSLFGEVDEEIGLVFEPLWEMSEKERAELQKTEAERDNILVDMGAFAPGEIRERVIDDAHMPFGDLDPEDVPDLREEEQEGLVPEGAGKGLEAVLGSEDPQNPGGGGAAPGGGPAPGGPKPNGKGGGDEDDEHGRLFGGGDANDDQPEVETRGPAWARHHEWMRGFDLPAQRRDGAQIVRGPGPEAARKGLRIGSRVRYERDSGAGTGRVFGFVAEDDSVGILDADNDKVLFVSGARAMPRPVAQDHSLDGGRGGDDADVIPFGGGRGGVDPLFAADAIGGEDPEVAGTAPPPRRSEGGPSKHPDALRNGTLREGPPAMSTMPPAMTTWNLEHSGETTPAGDAFNEADHPRRDDGKFGSGGGGGAEHDDPLAKEFEEQRRTRGPSLPSEVFRGSSEGNEQQSAMAEGGVYVTTDPKTAAQWGQVKKYRVKKQPLLIDLGDFHADPARRLVAAVLGKSAKKLTRAEFDETAAEIFIQNDGVDRVKQMGFGGYRFGHDAFLLGELSDYAGEGQAMDAFEWLEDDHPREEDGKFTSGGGGTKSKFSWLDDDKSGGKGKFKAPQLGLPYGPAYASGGMFHAPAPPPPPPLDPKKLKRVGEQMGSNPGGVFEDSDGRRYYVKKGKSKEHVRNELIAAALYRLAGSPTLRYRPVAGGEHVATEMAKLDKDNANKLSEEERGEAARELAVHAWLGNWDAAGLGGDNIGTVKGGPVSLDLGGALEYRAQGSPKGKAFGDEVSELQTLRDPKVNKDAAKIFAGMTPGELRESARYVTGLREDDIRRAVGKLGGKAALADKLVKRRDDIARQARTFGAEGPPGKATSTLVIPAGTDLPVKGLNGLAFTPWRPPADWAAVDGQADLDEPEFKVPEGKQAASGLIIREPDGRVWMVQPRNGFGGYEATFPKGRATEGLSLQANAIKEAWEESGIKARVVGHAGDHAGDLTMTRYYVAEREGGDPSQHDDETEGVVLAPQAKLDGFLNRERDREIAASLGEDAALDAVFRESDHPRRTDGKFGSGGGGFASPKDLAKAKKTVPLQLKYVPGAPKTAAAQKLVDGFNAKWAGKAVPDAEAAHQKIADFRALEAAAKKLAPAAAKPKPAKVPEGWAKELHEAAKKVAVENGIEESGVSVASGTKVSHMGGGVGVTMASADDKTGHITLYADHLTPKNYAGVLAHEICHVKYKALRDAWRKKDPAILERFNALYDGPGGPAFEALRKEDGVTDYSTMYWTAYTNKKGGPSNAVYETLAEMARKKQETGTLPGGPKLKALYALMDEHWGKAKGKAA